MEVKNGLRSPRVGIVDYGGGNVGSVSNALLHLGYEPVLLKETRDYVSVSKIIFPGVGNFGAAMQFLETKGIIDTLKESILEGKPFLGICLGYQVLFERSEESLGIKGLGLMKGKVIKFSKGKIPQIGWNYVEVPKKDSLLESGYYYFVNSFFPVPENEKIIAGVSEYERVKFSSAIEYKNIWGVQFHPEKSGHLGLAFLRRWARC